MAIKVRAWVGRGGQLATIPSRGVGRYAWHSMLYEL